MRRGRPYEIAIIGMGCRFAGASDLSTYFENILSAKDCTREVPRDRWDASDFCDPDSQANDRVPSCRGGYLDSPIRFDAAEHGIMPRTVEGGEPEQFLVLDAAVAALADAGLDLDALKRESRRGRDRPGELLQSREPDAASARPDDRPDTVDSDRPPPRMVRRPTGKRSEPIFGPACLRSRRRRSPVS